MSTTPAASPLTDLARPTPTLSGSGVLALGEALVELNAATDGPLLDSGALHIGYGGDTSNMAIATSRSGTSAGYLTRVGDDPFGDALHALWAREGVHADHVVREPSGSTGLYFVARSGPGGHSFTYRRADSPASRLTPHDVPEQAVARADLLHLSGITQAIGDGPCDAAFHAVETARAAGTLVSYDPNHRPALWSRHRATATIWHTAGLADLVLPNLEEGRMLTEREEPEEVLAALTGHCPGLVALKLGADGVLLGAGGQPPVHVAAHPVTPLDATGAGDTFDGAFAARLLHGDSPLEAAHYAVVAAALTTTGAGAVGPIPYAEVVRAARARAGR